MRKRILFFDKKVKVKTYELWKEIKDTYSEILLCECKHQECNGKYIKTKDYQTECLWGYNRKQHMLKDINYIIVKPNTAFPLYKEYEKYFKLNENVIFAYDKKIYTSNDLPEHLIEHEKVHLLQQNGIGTDNWVSLYLRDKDFRLKQEIEAYRHQLSVIKDKNARNKLKTEISEILSGEMYGNIVSKKEIINLLKE